MVGGAVILVLLQEQADWWHALEVAMTLPPGVSERRAHEDPWQPVSIDRPRRITDDLAWFRHAMERPAEHGFHAGDEATWTLDVGLEDEQRLRRLEERGVLAAAGFALQADESA
jgi:hypothetical protein